MNREILKKLIPAFISLSVFLLDRVSKEIVMKFLYFSHIPILPFFSLTYVENTGVAFGFLKDRNMFFIFSNTIFLGILLFLRKKFSSTLENIGIHFVIGGALGNIYDRLAYGYVVDFLDFNFFPAVFNLADSSITVGACLIGWEMLFNKRGKSEKN